MDMRKTPRRHVVSSHYRIGTKIFVCAYFRDKGLQQPILTRRVVKGKRIFLTKHGKYRMPDYIRERRDKTPREVIFRP